MTARFACRLLLSMVPAVVIGCPKDADKPAVTEPKTADAPMATQKPVEATRVSHEACVGRPMASPEEVLEIGGKAYERKGSTISLKVGDADDEFVVGQISDIKDHTPENAANLAIVLAWMKKAKVDAIAVTGDLGESAESVEKVLADVAALGVPVLGIVGNRECRDHFVNGMAAAQKVHKNIINMNQVRVFNTDDVSFVSMPGYYNKSYIHCAEGCEYTPDDVRALPDLVKGATGTNKVLLSHGPPKQAGALALDRIHEGANVGDPVLAEVLAGGLFPFGLFGNIQEAGGHATDLSGQNRVEPDTYVNSLYLNPGPIDSVRWVMLDQTESVGMAGIVKFKGQQAMYQIRRIAPGEAKVGAPAAKP